MAKAPKDVFVIIVAGGLGTRLWPLSRKKRPKQFLSLFNHDSFIQRVYHRALAIAPKQRVFIVAPEEYSGYLKTYLPEFPLGNFMGEPEKKGTTAAYGYTAAYIKQINPQAILHIIAADDHIVDEAGYTKSLNQAAAIASQEDTLVIYGVKPRDPNTGYGYVQIDPASKQIRGGVEEYLVKSFHEKPLQQTAKEYLEQGDYFWHVFGFTTSVAKLLSLISQYDPATSRVLDKIELDLRLPGRLEAVKLKKHYSELIESNIDNQVLEKMTESAHMVVLEDSWSDVGTWDHVYAIRKKDNCENVIVGDKDNLFNIGSTNNFITIANKPIALVGVNNMVIIDAGDIMLICDKNKSQDVKKMVNLLKERKLDQYL